MRINNQTLKHFAGSMATCLAAGLAAKKALELSAARTPSQALRHVVDLAAKGCDQGLPLSEALAAGAVYFPHHFLPVIQAGEISGRQAEAFQLLHQHCARIGPSLRAVRNTWLYPLVCIVFGWIIRTGIFLWFGKYQAAAQFAGSTFGTALVLGLACWRLGQQPAVRQAVGSVLLQIPLLRETQIRLAVVLFFSTFRLAYEAGGLGVVRLFDLALATVPSEALRQDLLKAREILARNGSIEDAFEQPELLEDELKGLIHAGSIGGHLDQSLAQIVEKTTWQLDLTLQMFNQFFQRLVVFSVAMSIVETLLICRR